MIVIQNSVYPTYSLCSEKELYFRFNDHVDLDMNRSLLNLSEGGKVFTDTYFNSVSVGKWKRHTNINNLTFTIKVKGNVKITWFLHRAYFSGRILGEDYISNSELSEVSIPLKFWDSLEDGGSLITDFYYSTTTEPTNDVKLGIIITHFNRQKYVLPAIDRLKKQLLDLTEFKDKVSLFVVDNSQNLPQINGVTIIPNENLGGAGGFSRGL